MTPDLRAVQKASTEAQARVKRGNANRLETSDQAKSFLDYDSVTGVLIWAKDIGYKIKRGDEAGTIAQSGYRIVIVRGVSYKAHRLGWLLAYGEWPTGCIDHINGLRADNRLVNLRQISLSGNAQNQRKPHANNTSGFLGVSWNKENSRWEASIRASNKVVHLGYFVCPEQAHAVYLEKKRELHEACTI